MLLAEELQKLYDTKRTNLVKATYSRKQSTWRALQNSTLRKILLNGLKEFIG